MPKNGQIHLIANLKRWCIEVQRKKIYVVIDKNTKGGELLSINSKKIDLRGTWYINETYKIIDGKADVEIGIYN